MKIIEDKGGRDKVEAKHGGSEAKQPCRDGRDGGDGGSRQRRARREKPASAGHHKRVKPSQVNRRDGNQGFDNVLTWRYHTDQDMASAVASEYPPIISPCASSVEY